MPAAYTSACSVQVSDFEDLRLLIPCIRLYAVPVRRASALPAASFRSYLSIATLAVRLTLPPVGCVKNFHASFKSAVIFKQMRPAGHTHKKSPALKSGAFAQAIAWVTYSRQRPTLPDSYPSSTIGSEGLNCRVRNGNGCFPLDIVTGKIGVKHIASQTYDNLGESKHFPMFLASQKKNRLSLTTD